MSEFRAVASLDEVPPGTMLQVELEARFDLETGAPRALPAVRPVKTYEARVEGEEIQVRVG
jgi:nitrite reductase/ring-hydroxylating ferredoxin subunit